MTVYSACQQHYLLDDYGNMTTWYSINAIGGLNPVSTDDLPELLIREEQPHRAGSLQDVHNQYNHAIRTMANRFGWSTQNILDDKLATIFKDRLLQEECQKWIELDLSGLTITILPPHFQYFINLEKLNLAGNDLSILPPQLQKLPALTELNISGNKRLQPNIPSWIGTMTQLKLIAYDIQLRCLPEGLCPSQIQCETELSGSSNTSRVQDFSW